LWYLKTIQINDKKVKTSNFVILKTAVNFKMEQIKIEKQWKFIV